MTAGGFRPLTGIKVSEPRYSMANSISYVVFVPSRGFRYLNDYLDFSVDYVNGFRPLAGIKVSELPLDLIKNKKEKGFRPLAGIKVSELGNYLTNDRDE